MKDSILVVIFFTSLCFSAIQTRATPAKECRNSTYQSNLETLLSYLTSNATNCLTGFYNDSVGSNPPDVAYGAFLCRGDISKNHCSKCVSTLTAGELEKCSDSKNGSVWSHDEECMLRYTNTSFFGDLHYDYRRSLDNPSIITDDPDRFGSDLMDTLNDLANRAAAGDRNGKKFAVGETIFSDSRTIFGLAQCTPDLSSSECNECIRTCMVFFAGCCLNKIGARIQFSSCMARYELYPFYNATAIPPPPSPPPNLLSPPPPPVKNTKITRALKEYERKLG